MHTPLTSSGSYQKNRTIFRFFPGHDQSTEDAVAGFREGQKRRGARQAAENGCGKGYLITCASISLHGQQSLHTESNVTGGAVVANCATRSTWLHDTCTDILWLCAWFLGVG